VADMDARSNFGAAKMLYIELGLAVRESRCASLKHSGYNAASASPQLAEIVLRSQKFDLMVLSSLNRLCEPKASPYQSERNQAMLRSPGL
jgi:hypothetical protein